MLTALGDKRPQAVHAQLEPVTIADIIETLTEEFRTGDLVLFQSFFGKVDNRYELVAYFLAMLQMIRDQQLNVLQDQPNGPLWLYKNLDENEAYKIIRSKSSNHTQQLLSKESDV